MATKMATCSEPTACEDGSEGEPASPAAEDLPQSMEREFDFVEKPTQDFFCPVSFEYLLEPQLTFVADTIYPYKQPKDCKKRENHVLCAIVRNGALC